MVENYCIWASECIAVNLNPGAGNLLQLFMKEGGTLRAKIGEAQEDLEETIRNAVELCNNDEERKQRAINKFRQSEEESFWSEASIHTFLTMNGAMFLPPEYSLIRQDVARRCRERLASRQISPTEPGDFSSTEEIVRWLGYGRVYDNPDECLFTGLILDAEDINPERDIIKTRIRIPLLDTSDAPLFRVHKSVTEKGAWRTTREGCSSAAPHVSMERYHADFENRIGGSVNFRTQVCHVTGMTFLRPPNWLEMNDYFSGHWLIPVSEATLLQFNDWLDGNGTPNGLPASEWSTRWLQPRVVMKPLN